MPPKLVGIVAGPVELIGLADDVRLAPPLVLDFVEIYPEAGCDGWLLFDMGLIWLFTTNPFDLMTGDIPLLLLTFADPPSPSFAI